MLSYPNKSSKELQNRMKSLFTGSPRLSLVSVHEEAVPGGTEHAAELRDSKSIGVTADCGNTPAQRG